MATKKSPVVAFERCVAALRALGPIPTTRKAKPPPALAERATDRGPVWAYAAVERMPSSGKVNEHLSFISDEDLRFDSLEGLTTPAAAMSSSLWLGIGAWNVGDSEARWAGARDRWIVIQAELRACAVVVAAWRVEQGLALFVTPGDGGVARVAAVSGLPLTEGAAWSEAKVFYGEN